MSKSKAIAVTPSQELSRTEPVQRDRAYASYLKELNPRGNEDVQLALAASADPRYQLFLEKLNMPRYRRVGLQTVAKACGISLMEFNQWWQRESAQRALAHAQNGSVIITRDMVQDAKSIEVFCGRCDGLGFVTAPPGLPEDIPGYRIVVEATEKEAAKYIRTCPNCGGNKKIRKPGDQHSRDKVLDMAGLIKKGAGITVVQNFGGANHSSAVSDLDRALTLDITAEEM